MNNMKNAVLIGAGQYGRGVIGMLLERSGYHVLLADINEDVINDINSRGFYTVRRPGSGTDSVTVSNISAMSSIDPELPARCADADIVCTCAGLSVLEKIAPVIARSIVIRREGNDERYINFLACENAIGGSTVLKMYVYALLSGEDATYADIHAGFPDCAIDGIIPPAAREYPADVTAEPYYEWDSLKSGFKGEYPEIEGLSIVGDLSKYLERKLFTLNGPNAVTGALGYLKGYSTVQASLEDPEIYGLVWSMMEQAGGMLSKRHGFLPEEMLEYRTFIMNRFRNPMIIDSNERVAREPMRKLDPNDRVVAPMNLALSYGLDVSAYIKGIAALMSYSNPRDEQSIQIQDMISAMGFSAALEVITGIVSGSGTSAQIEKEYLAIQAGL